jgi:hypothetical protein
VLPGPSYNPVITNHSRSFAAGSIVLSQGPHSSSADAHSPVPHSLPNQPPSHCCLAVLAAAASHMDPFSGGVVLRSAPACLAAPSPSPLLTPMPAPLLVVQAAIPTPSSECAAATSAASASTIRALQIHAYCMAGASNGRGRALGSSIAAPAAPIGRSEAKERFALSHGVDLGREMLRASAPGWYVTRIASSGGVSLSPTAQAGKWHTVGSNAAWDARAHPKQQTSRWTKTGGTLAPPTGAHSALTTRTRGICEKRPWGLRTKRRRRTCACVCACVQCALTARVQRFAFSPGLRHGQDCATGVAALGDAHLQVRQRMQCLPQ